MRTSRKREADEEQDYERERQREERDRNSIDLPVPDTDGEDSDATIDYDPQNLNFTEYWKTTTTRSLGSATDGIDYLPYLPDCEHDVKCDMVTDDTTTGEHDDPYVEVEFYRGISQWLVFETPTTQLRTDERYVVRH